MQYVQHFNQNVKLYNTSLSVRAITPGPQQGLFPYHQAFCKGYLYSTRLSVRVMSVASAFH